MKSVLVITVSSLIIYLCCLNGSFVNCSSNEHGTFGANDTSGQHGYSPPQARNRIDILPKLDDQTTVTHKYDHGGGDRHNGLGGHVTEEGGEDLHGMGTAGHLKGGTATRPDVGTGGGHGGGGNGAGGHGGAGDHHGGVHLASWRWTEYSSAIMFTGAEAKM